MKTYDIRRECVVPRPISEVFDFFSDAGNLEELTPPWLKFRVLTPDVRIEEGARIDYRLKLRGIPLHWTSLITVWEPPRRFVDEQVRGPYRLWRHEHAFEETEGGTRVRDHVAYAVWLGLVVNPLFIRPDLERVFDYRAERLRARFGEPA